MREFLLVIHILAVGAWIGGNATQFLVTPKMRDRGGAAAAAWMTSVVRMGRLLYTPAALIVLLSGIGLVLDSAVYDFEQTFVVIGVAMVVVGAVLGMRVFGPKGQRAADAFESGDDAAGAAVVNGTMPFGLLDTALLIVTITAMVSRWGI